MDSSTRVTPTAKLPPASADIAVKQFREAASIIEAEVGKVIVGQADVVRHVLICIVAGGHVLLEGAPGAGKTMVVKNLADRLGLQFFRIQFNPRPMPADIAGPGTPERTH